MRPQLIAFKYLPSNHGGLLQCTHLHAFLILVLISGGWAASVSGRLNLRERAAVNHWIGADWVPEQV